VNFSVKKLNDASVLVLMECDTPHFKGLMLYPLPFLGENDDDDVCKLVAEHPTKKVDDSHKGDLDYHVIFNLTPYSESVAQLFMVFGIRTSTGLLALACNSNVHDYIVQNAGIADYKVLPATDQIHGIFDTIDPLKIAKFASIIRTV